MMGSVDAGDVLMSTGRGEDTGIVQELDEVNFQEVETLMQEVLNIKQELSEETSLKII